MIEDINSQIQECSKDYFLYYRLYQISTDYEAKMHWKTRANNRLYHFIKRYNVKAYNK